MNILMLFNNFNGAYGSLKIFQDEIVSSVSDGDRIFISYSSAETLKICRNYAINFSLGIGMFDQYIGGLPVYEVTGVRHFQWIIDNPLKIDVDAKSSLITYVLINKGFIHNLIPCKNRPLFIPIGIIGKYKSIDLKNKKEGIVFSGQIKKAVFAEDVFFNGEQGEAIKLFCEEYENKLDVSFESSFYRHFGWLPLDVQKKIFRPINTYFRAKKREIVIKSIIDYPVYIMGDVMDEDIKIKWKKSSYI